MSAERRRGVQLRLLLIACLVLLAVCCTFSVPALWVVTRSGAGTPDGRPVQVEIPDGSTTEDIADVLTEAGVVDNGLLFRLYARSKKADGRLRAGIYDLTTGMSYEDVVKTLKAGPPISYVTVVIPEGFTIDQIAERLEKQAGISAVEFTAVAKTGAGDFGRRYLGGHGGSLEGYLFPKTYRIRKGAKSAEVIEQMLRQFESETADLDLAYARQNHLDLHQVLTIASMIEKEAKLEKERPLISSVIYNRLDRDIVLEIDATIEYVLAGHRFRLSNADLRIDSPYNTYRNKGLPPGPIANPGIASIRAAAHPAETRYLYYVLTGRDGSHTFTTNWAEFMKAKERSKAVFGR